MQCDIDEQLKSMVKQRLHLDKYLKEQGDINLRGKRDSLLLRVFELSQNIECLEYHEEQQVSSLSDSWLIINIFINSLSLLGAPSAPRDVQLKQLSNHS